MQRIVMGLRSGLDSEEEYSLDRLIVYSFERGDDLYVSQFPPLADLLFERIESVGKLVEEFKMDDQKDSVDNAQFVKRLNRITQAALIVRNLSINHHNAKLFAEQRYTKDTLVQILNLPTRPNFSELKNYALDMVELMASSFSFFNPDPLFDALAIGLGSDDRGVLLGSMKSLSRFVMGRDEFNRLGEISDSVVFRITGLLMLEDEDLASACLDFLYQYTANDENVEKLLQPPQGVEVTRHLIRLLLFQGLTGEQIVYLRQVKRPPSTPRDIPPLPQDIINDLLGYPEPERAAKW
jgi:chromatin structure-remodeling complex subunit RSC9